MSKKNQLQSKKSLSGHSRSLVPFLLKFGMCMGVAAIMAFNFGCSNSESAAVEGASDANSSGSVANATTGTSAPMPTVPTQEPNAKQEEDDSVPDEDETEDGGVLKQAGDLFGKAASSSGAAKDWVQDQLSGAAGASGQAADDTIKWANDTFKSLKEKGLTTASDTSEWLSQDWKNSQCWQYKIVSLAGENDVMAEELNKLGQGGWECFHTEGGRFFFKKPSESYLRELPFKDFIKLVPLLQKATQ